MKSLVTPARPRVFDAKRLIGAIAVLIAVLAALVVVVVGPPRGSESHAPKENTIAVAQAVAGSASTAEQTERLPLETSDQSRDEETTVECGLLDDAVLAAGHGAHIPVGAAATRHLAANQHVPGSTLPNPPFEPPRA